MHSDLFEHLLELLHVGAPAERLVQRDLLADVRLEALVPNPSKYLAIGMNYAKHVEEARRAGIQVPDSQVWFNQQVSCINGPFDSPVARCVS